MLVMVDLHGHGVDVGLQSIWGKGQGWKFVKLSRGRSLQDQVSFLNTTHTGDL